METPESFIEQYRIVFERLSAAEIVEHFAFPLQVAGDIVTGVVVAVATSKEQWTQQLEGLLGGYRKLGVAKSRARSLDVVTIAPNLAQARVHWDLFTAAGQPIYDFHSVYTLGRFEGGLRIIAIAHDELPRLRGALAKTGA
jgi:hypothetical protein